jgi:nitroreductase
MSDTLIKLLNSRKATRAISEQKLDDRIIAQLQESTQLSASCFNNQPWRFLFLSEDAALEKGREALSPGNHWAKRAPLLVIGFSAPELDCQLPDGRQYFLFDLGMATQLLLLQATELDLVARPMAGFSPEVIRRNFDVPENLQPYVVVAIGFAGDLELLDEKLRQTSTAPRKRNPLAVNFFKNGFKA